MGNPVQREAKSRVEEKNGIEEKDVRENIHDKLTI